MKIPTTADVLNEALSIVALDGIDPAKMSPAKVYGTDESQQVDGRSVYRLPNVYVKDGDYKATVSIKVFDRPQKAIPELTHIRLVGAVSITPYVQNGSSRIGYSVVADGVEAAA